MFSAFQVHLGQTEDTTNIGLYHTSFPSFRYTWADGGHYRGEYLNVDDHYKHGVIFPRVDGKRHGTGVRVWVSGNAYEMNIYIIFSVWREICTLRNEKLHLAET